MSCNEATTVAEATEATEATEAAAAEAAEAAGRTLGRETRRGDAHPMGACPTHVDSLRFKSEISELS